jgi:hypothetical protein
MTGYPEPENVKLSGQRCLCSRLGGGCGKYFNSTAAFEKHRVWAEGKVVRRCLTEEEMRAKGMDINRIHFWVTELRQDPQYGPRTAQEAP